MLFFRNSRNLEKALDRVLRKAARKPFEADDRILHRAVISQVKINLPSLLTAFKPEPSGAAIYVRCISGGTPKKSDPTLRKRLTGF
jgi:hypothetical protein